MKKNWPVIILISIAIALCFQNYTPGTILSGWDTLHPEFNFGLAIKREVFGVFRTYQGLGTVAAHSDMADLPRIILLYLLSPFIPMSFLRYFYIFLNLILGPIGMYCFLKRVVFSKTPKESTIPSFLGALFYLLNLGTMQQFVVPFEMFTTQYATLPWLFLFATNYLCSASEKSEYQNSKYETNSNFQNPNVLNVLNFKFLSFGIVSDFALRASNFCLGIPKRFGGDRKSLLLFAITTILAAPMAYAATLWYVYFIAFTMYVSVLVIIGKKVAVRGLTLILLTLLINSFWILPNIYFVFNHASEVTQANINKLFSPQAFLYNKEFGNIKDISLLKTFLFDWNVYVGNNQFSQLLSPWIQHLKQPFVELLGYLLALTAFVGIIYSIFLRNKILIALLPLLLLCLLFLFNDNFPTSYFYGFIADKIPFFKEIFRFPQNKVLGIFTFVFAVYFAIGQSLITNVYKRIKTAQVIIFVALIIYFMLPAFKGHFISPYMRIKIPEVYFEMFKWFDKEPPSGRIANLPIHSLWGWEYHDWNGNSEPSFQGAGFIWFGIKQPVLARDFDRWIPYNKQYYREMSYSIYSQNPEALKLVLEKYNIKYILFDKSIIAPQDNSKGGYRTVPSKVLLHQETQTLLNQQDYIEKIKEFGNNLIVYKVKSKKPNSHYILKRPYEEYYPFRNLADNQNKVLPNIIKLTQEGVVIKLPKNTRTLTLPSYLDIEESIPSDLLVEKSNNQLIITFYPHLPIYNLKDKPIPIFVKAELPKNENVILSINKKDNFILKTLPSNTPLSLGTVFLKTKEENMTTLYPLTPNEEILPDLSTIEYYVEPCQDIEDQRGHRTAPSFGIEKVNANSFNIFGKNVALCTTIPLSELIQKELKYEQVLLNVTFDYKSNLPLKFCLAKLINGACQNYNGNRLNQLFGLQDQDIQDLGLQFLLDTTQRDAPDGPSQSNKIEKATYENLSINLTYPFFSASFSNSSIPSFPSNPSTPSNPSSLILPFSGNKELSADITKLPKTHGYCPNSPISNPPLIKKQILTNSNDRFIRYQSIDGLSCDHFSYQNLSQNQAYLVAITSRNIKGLPVTLCVTNAVSKHCDIYTTLSSHKDFNTDIFLLPPQIKNENGFDISIGNLGIKKSPSINDLKSIEIIPIPYKWLAQIKTLNAEPKKNPDSVLVLPQSFEKGWKAYQVKNEKIKMKNWINRTFPFFFGEELKEHVLVNNWANGWELNDPKTIQQFNNLNNEAIVIVFLPQYLEYLGFILLLGTLTYLTVQGLRNKPYT